VDGVIYLVALDAKAADEGLGITEYARVVNADGSYGGVSGNGARCVAKLMIERGRATTDDAGGFSFGMGRRVVNVRAHRDGEMVTRVSVDLGYPVITLARVPIDVTQIEGKGDRPGEWRVLGRDAFFVSVGNPHMVMFREGEWLPYEIESEGIYLTAAPPFPEGMNIDCAQIMSRERVKLITYERGVGVTRACGSGALATAIAGREMALLENDVTIEMPGGTIDVQHDEDTSITWTTADVSACDQPAA